jgi:hypothetical protein
MVESEQLHKSGPDRGEVRLRPAWRELDAGVAEALRPALPALVDEVIAAVEDAVPDYRDGVAENVRLGVHQALDGFVELVVTGSDERLPAREVYFEFGRGEHRVGRTLDALLTAYRAGAQVAWRGLADAGDAAGLAPRDLYTLAEAIFAYIDEISAASAEGFAHEQSLAASERDARRRRLAELLLSDPPPPADAIEAAAAEAGWELPRAVAVLTYEADHPERVAARLPGDALVGEQAGAPVAIVTDPDGPGRRAELERALGDSRAGLGGVVDWPRAPESARHASLALSLARGGELVDAGRRRLDLILLSDPPLAQALAADRLGRLSELPEGRRARLLETLGAWLDAHGEVRAVAERLHVHVQTVRYRLGQLRDLYGDELDDPVMRLELELALRVAALPGTRASAAGE